MNQQHRWLRAEIAAWQKEGVVSPAQAAILQARYAEEQGGAPWGLILFGSAAAAAIGTGLILLISYNWAKIPRLGKLGFILAALVVVQGLGAIYLRASDWKRQVGQALGVLGTLVFGAGIFLVAQVYHIDEHFPAGLFIWALGGLAAAWILDSVPQALIAVVLLTWWSGADILQFEQPEHQAFAWILVGVAPLAWRLRSAVLLGFVLAALYLILLCITFRFGRTAEAATASFAFAALLVAAAKLSRLAGGRWNDFAGVCGFFGYTGFVAGAYLLSFAVRDAALYEDFGIPAEADVIKFAYSWGLFALALAAWAVVAGRSARAGELQRHPADWVVPLATILTFYLFYGASVSQRLHAGHVYTVLLLVIAVSWMWRGSRTGGVRDAVLGSLLLAAVLLARYFDLFDNLASRGAAFLGLGVILIAEAWYYRRNRRRIASGEELP